MINGNPLVNSSLSIEWSNSKVWLWFELSTQSKQSSMRFLELVKLCLYQSPFVNSLTYSFDHSVINTSILTSSYTVSIHQSILPFAHPSVHLCIHLLIHPSIHPSIHSFIHSFNHLFVHSFIHCIHPSLQNFLSLNRKQNDAL